MEKKISAVRLITLLACCFLLPQVSAIAETIPDVCGLYTQADAGELFNQTVSDGIARSTMFPAGESCRYSFTNKGDTYGVTVRIATTASISDEGMNSSAGDLMTRQKKARKAGGHAADTFHPETGLGDDAFWNGTDLWVLQGEYLLIIKVHSLLEGTFEDMASARTARQEQDLSLSHKVAKTILSRLQ